MLWTFWTSGLVEHGTFRNSTVNWSKRRKFHNDVSWGKNEILAEKFWAKTWKILLGVGNWKKLLTTVNWVSSKFIMKLFLFSWPCSISGCLTISSSTIYFFRSFKIENLFYTEVLVIEWNNFEDSKMLSFFFQIYKVIWDELIIMPIPSFDGDLSTWTTQNFGISSVESRKVSGWR